MSKPSRRASRGPAGVSGPGATPTRAGRRERARTGYARKSFLERNRSLIVALATLAIVGLVFAFLVMSVTAKSYECGQSWEPAPTPKPAPGQSPRLGYVQRDMGAGHNPGTPARYTLCPPASGAHLGVGAPIQPRVYGPDDFAPPQTWLHNLEHGGIAILYRGGEGSEALTDAGQAKLNDLYQNFPNSPICGFERGNPDNGVVIARFDDMAWPYAAIVWDRVLPLQTLDADLIYRFWATEAERTNPENRCPDKPRTSPTPVPSGSAAPSGSVEPSGSVAPSGSPAPSAS